MKGKVLAVKKIISTLLVAAFVMGALAGPAPVAAADPLTANYSATPEKGAIEFALLKGFMWKYPDGQFHGEDQISQGQFVSSLVAIREVKEGEPVPQLPEGHWAKATYERAQKAGILAGVEINPNKLLNKEETALLVFNAWKPYRGVKGSGFTNTGALVTWGWMNPAPQGQPKFREDLPVTRTEAAVILRKLWQDKYQLELGEKYALEFHNSIKIEHGYMIGTVPKGSDLFTINVQFYRKDFTDIVGFLNGQTFKVKIDDFRAMGLIITNDIDHTYAAAYQYLDLNKKERIKKTQQFS